MRSDPPPAVLLLHGQPGSGADFDAVVAALPDGTATLAPDRPGYGTNPAPPGDYEANARWAAGELDRAGIDRAVVVGHSWGGGAALTLAALDPDRVAGLVLLSSVGPGEPALTDRLLTAPVLGPLASRFAFQLTPALARPVVRWRARRRGRALRADEDVYAQTAAEIRHTHGAAWRSFLVEQRAMVEDAAALGRRLDLVRAPAVLLADPDDQVVPADTARALHARLPGSRLVLTDGGGHHLPRTRADAVAAAVVSLAEHRPRP